MTISCRLLGPGGESAPAADATVVADLGKLVAFEGLTSRGFGMVRSGIDFEAECSLQVTDAVEGGRYALQLFPVAFDRASGEVTFGRCALRRLLTDGESEPLISTTLAVRDGEATVLGASGAEPLFFLMRCTVDRTPRER